jgi:hypothetical protein
MPTVVIGGLDDVALTAEAVRYGARFVTRPVDLSAFLEVIGELLAGRPPRDAVSARRWPRKAAALPATVSDAAARVLDLSYGGLRLECDGTPDLLDDDEVDVALPTVGLSVKAIPRWIRPPVSGGSWSCGVELSAVEQRSIREWHVVVDSLR